MNIQFNFDYTGTFLACSIVNDFACESRFFGGGDPVKASTRESHHVN